MLPNRKCIRDLLVAADISNENTEFMIRYFLAKGDRAGGATIIDGLKQVTCSNPPPRVEIATLGMKTYCATCKNEGFIAPKGPRRKGTAPNGKGWALSGDVNICGCNPSPVFYAERGMKMTLAPHEIDAWRQTVGLPPLAESIHTHRQYDELIVLKDEQGHPVANQRYRIETADGQRIEGVTNDAGETMRIRTDGPTQLLIELLV
jgi:hypothetical protein